MFDLKDPKIKLFGKTIELPETFPAASVVVENGGGGSNSDLVCSLSSVVDDSKFIGEKENQELDKNLLNPKQTDAKSNGEPPSLKLKELDNSKGTSQINDDDSRTLSDESDAEAMKTSKTEEELTDASNSQEKPLKKPDKILPCPRCNSMDTKFCYFNNYNVSQPRHFCRNCQRYWTAGGTMRNVPVGAGRRKNKHVASQFDSEALPNGIQLNPNGTVIAFNSDASLSESIVSGLNIADKKIQKGPHKPEELQIPVSHGSSEYGEVLSIGSSVAPMSSKDATCKMEPIPNGLPFPQPVPLFPGAPFPYPWNPFGSVAPFGSIAPPSFPLPFYNTGGPYWGCVVPGAWNVPWVVPPTPAVLPCQTPPNSGPISPLGKHSRDETFTRLDGTQRESDSEKCLWVPKTLRIDDPREAAKSSIWETLGIKNERGDSVGGRGIFKVFESQSKGDDKRHVPETSTILQANPAALSRSNNFRETS